MKEAGQKVAESPEPVSLRLARLGLQLPPVPAPVGNFVPGRVHRSLLFLSGQGPLLENGQLARGQVGQDVSVDAARHHARRTGLVLVSAMADLPGGLDRVARIVRLFGLINAVPDFEDHETVADGCSDLLREVFGDAGAHARSTVGVPALPGGITVEFEAVVAIREAGEAGP